MSEIKPFYPVIFDPPSMDGAVPPLPADNAASPPPKSIAPSPSDNLNLTLMGGVTPNFCRQAENLSSELPPASDAIMATPMTQPTAQLIPQPSFAPPLPSRMEQVLYPTLVSNAPAEHVKAYNVTQEFLAQRPIHLCGEVFYVYNGRAYAPVTVEQLKRYVMTTCRGSVQKKGSPDLLDHVVKFLRGEENIVMSEVDRGFLSFCNGLLRLVDGKLLPHTAGVFSTARVEANCTPQLAGKHPLFSRFLAQISGGDTALERRIWQMLGYALTPDTNAKSFFLLQGVPNSGKSLLGELLTRLLPDDAVTSLSLNDLGRNFGPSELVGKSLCLSMDLPAAPWDSKAVGMLKALTGNDLVTADVKYQPRAKFRNSATFLFGTNHAVALTQSDPAILQRLVVIPFRYAIPREQQDRQLLEKLLIERDAIVASAMNAYWNLRRDNYIFAGDFGLNEVIAQTCQGEIPLAQAVAEFVSTACVLEDGAESFTSDLYRVFRTRYPGANYTAFATHLVNCLDNMFPGKVTKGRSRKLGEVNPTSVLKGVRLKGEPGILSTANCIL